MTDDTPPPPRIDYARQAEQALDLARRTNSPDEKAKFEEIARLWRHLAERGERR